MCEGSFLPSSFGPHQKHTEFESSLRSYPINPSRFWKGGDHAPPRFIRHIAARIALVACSHAEAPSSLLRIRILALHHFQLLSTAALAKYTAPAHLVSGNSGAGAATVHLRGG